MVSGSSKSATVRKKTASCRADLGARYPVFDCAPRYSLGRMLADFTMAIAGNVSCHCPSDYTWGWRGQTQHNREQETKRNPACFEETFS